jgi:hypothetical protein
MLVLLAIVQVVEWFKRSASKWMGEAADQGGD